MEDGWPASKLRAFLDEAGFTYESLARAVCAVARENGDHGLRANRSSVAHWLAGSVPARRTRTYLAEALTRRLGRTVTEADLQLGPAAGGADVGLDLGDDPVRTLGELASADLGRRSFL